MNYSKVVGWILLIAGLILVIWTLYTSFSIFTARADAPEFFEIPKEEALSQKEQTGDIQAQMQQLIEEQLKGVIPVDSIIKLLNLAVWSMLAFILIFGGTQISSLGIKLVRKS